MKSTIVDTRASIEERTYPCLMNCDGLIVLFKSDNTGTVLNTNGGWTLGDQCDGFDMKEFVPFLGKIILES